MQNLKGSVADPGRGLNLAFRFLFCSIFLKITSMKVLGLHRIDGTAFRVCSNVNFEHRGLYLLFKFCFIAFFLITSIKVPGLRSIDGTAVRACSNVNFEHHCLTESMKTGFGSG
jgi:hypothetical protein